MIIRVLDFYTDASTFNISVNAEGPNNGRNIEACIAETSIELSWDASTGTPPTGYIVFAQAGATVPTSVAPGNASSYAANPNYAGATTYGTLGKAVYKGNATNATITGLNNTLDYTFKVIAYFCETGTGWRHCTQCTRGKQRGCIPSSQTTAVDCRPDSHIIASGQHEAKRGA